MNRLIIIGVILLLASCDNEKIKIRGNIYNFVGDIQLLVERPDGRGYKFLGKTKVDKNAMFSLTVKNVVPPAMLSLISSNGDSISFIADKYNTFILNGTFTAPKNMNIEGSTADKYYKDVKAKISDYYVRKINKFREQIKPIELKKNKTAEDYAIIKSLGVRIDNHKYLMNRYISDIIRQNLDKDFTMFLLKTELKDSLDLRKRLFLNLKPSNKKSNIYRLLERELK